MDLVVKLSMFEGPMDLLLHLIRKAEINIEDIFVSQITEQYLAIIDEAKQMDMAVAGEFITMAATLIEIKSRSLLPKPETPEDELPEDYIDPQEMLIAQLQLYNLFKENAGQMRELEREGVAHRYKLPEEILPPKPELDLGGVTAQTLYDAFSSLLLRRAEQEARSPSQRIIRRDAFTVPDRMAYLRRVLRKRGHAHFDELFGDAVTRAEIVVTFMAMLEMMRLGRITIEQKGTFDAITLNWREAPHEAASA